MLLDATEGNIAATYVYDAFGTILLQTGTADNSITYTGYQYDDETGLYYVNARYYDSTTARFLTEDTYQGRQNDPLSLNRYTYCHNNPIRYYDPSGHFALFATFLVGALVGGVMEYVDQKYFQKKENVDWKAVGYESLMGGALATLSVVTGGVGTTAVVTSTVAKSAGKSALKTAAKSTVKNVVKTTFKKTAKKAVKNTVKSTVKKVAKTAIKTGVSEAAQGFVTDVGRQVVVDGKSLDEVDYGQAAMTASISGAFGMVGGMTSSVAKSAKASAKSKVAKYTNKVAKRVDDVVAKADDTVQAVVKKTKVGSVASAGTGSKSGYVSSGSATKSSKVTGTVRSNKVRNGVTKGAGNPEAHNVVNYMKLKEQYRVSELGNDVVDSLRTNGKLPGDYITKADAYKAGWQEGKALNNYAPGKQIGGDIFKNDNGILPKAQERVWYEADVGMDYKMSRSKNPGYRILYSNDGLIYGTYDHYQSVFQIGK